LPRGGQVRHVTLEVPLPALTLGRDVERHHPRVPGIQVLHEALDGAALAGGVPALEDDHEAAARILDPVLELEQLDLEQPFQMIVFLAAQPLGIGIILPPGVHHAPVGVAEHRVVLVRFIHPYTRPYHASVQVCRASPLSVGHSRPPYDRYPCRAPALSIRYPEHRGQLRRSAALTASFTRSSLPARPAGPLAARSRAAA